jgi:hypothetical protein
MQWQGIVYEVLGLAEPSADGQHRPAQIGKRRARRIQAAKPSSQCGRIGHAMGIFENGRRSLPATPLDEIAAQSLAAGGQAVMAVGRREWRQEGERLAATVADAASNPDPIVVFIVGLFAPATVADNGILNANRATTQNDFRARLGPVGFEVVLRGGK